jgi:hypothetical protein
MLMRNEHEIYFSSLPISSSFFRHALWKFNYHNAKIIMWLYFRSFLNTTLHHIIFLLMFCYYFVINLIVLWEKIWITGLIIKYGCYVWYEYTANFRYFWYTQTETHILWSLSLVNAYSLPYVLSLIMKNLCSPVLNQNLSISFPVTRAKK